ncbi:phage major tail tube protein [Brucella intermedia]|uniref:Major tail tube protein n=1 Tax=Brucella intermedia M86 TaxID=1234597 RepID=M5JRD6_9HYPH|nr:phage major tail tube protein [Brucella intermedia]ELT50283.1 major tail tube protein [Brucella intermedia M86]
MQTLYQMVAVDVRRAEEAGSSRANLVSKLTIPSLKFITSTHNPGGGVMSVDFSQPRIEAPEPAMEVKGFDTDIFRDLGEVSRWIFAGAVKDKKTGKLVPSRAIIEGAITEWTPDEGSPEDFMGCNHLFKEVTHYEFTLNGEELFYVDFWERILRTGGVDRFSDVRRALGA